MEDINKEPIVEVEPIVEPTDVATGEDALQGTEGQVEDTNTQLAEQARLLEDREAEIFKKEVSLSLKENGLEMFEGVLNITDTTSLKEVVSQLTNIVNQIKVSASYIPPKENLKQAEYDVFSEKKDVKGMIGSKFANLFK